MNEKTLRMLEIGGVVVAGAIVFYMVHHAYANSAADGIVVNGGSNVNVPAAVPTGSAPDFQTYNWPKIPDPSAAGILGSMLPNSPDTNYYGGDPKNYANNNGGGDCGCGDCGCSDEQSLSGTNLFPSLNGLADYYSKTVKGFVSDATDNMLSAIPDNIAQYFNNPRGEVLSRSSGNKFMSIG